MSRVARETSQPAKSCLKDSERTEHWMDVTWDRGHSREIWKQIQEVLDFILVLVWHAKKGNTSPAGHWRSV
jgi:hypothetical protein